MSKILRKNNLCWFVFLFICFLGSQVFGEELKCSGVLGKEICVKSSMAQEIVAGGEQEEPACSEIVSAETCRHIGQMIIIGFGGFNQDKDSGEILWNDPYHIVFNEKSLIAKHIAKDHISGAILFSHPVRDAKTEEFIRDRNIQGPVQVAKLNKDLQDYNSLQRKQQGLIELPLFIGVDQEGGRIDRLPTTHGFPVKTIMPQSLGAKEESALHFWRMIDKFYGNTRREAALQESYNYANELAKEIVTANFNLNFAPVVDININPTNPIIGGLGRSFSANPRVVVDQARQFIRAFDENKIIPVLKHFPGHGSSTGDSHDGLVDVTKYYQADKELYPYRKIIDGKYDGMVMTTHVINGVIDKTPCKPGDLNDPATWCPGTMSYNTLTRLLREDLGFKGLIVSDDMTMGAITNHYQLRDVLKRAINAGVDIFIISNNKGDETNRVINAIAELVKSGEVAKEKIDKIYERIVEFKKRRLLGIRA